MKETIKKARQFKSTKEVKNVLLIVSFLLVLELVFDLVAVLCASYVSGNIEALLGKSTTVILSDLLFLEGAVILAIGIFIAVARAWQETKPSSESTTETTNDEELTRDKRIHPGMLMMVVGAILIGLSIMVGTLFP